MKKIVSILSCVLAAVSVLASCGAENDTITVITREESSGTRSAFVEIMEIVDGDGNDAICDTAETTEKTSVMLTSVVGNKKSIGYVSLGSLSDEVKAVKVDGAEPTIENIKSGDYKIARNFNLAYKEDELSDVAKDFVSYILSNQGQAIIEEKGYVRFDSDKDYKASGTDGKIVLAGSTSVAPVMDILATEYMELNSGVEIEIQQSGSSAGITSAIEGACDIGMSSRDLKDEEKAELSETKIAIDGIVVIVNKENTVDDLTSEQIKAIFLGETAAWGEIG